MAIRKTESEDNAEKDFTLWNQKKMKLCALMGTD